jgi:hypothetical protein
MMPAMTAADENRADEPVEARRAGGRRRR